VGNTVKQINRFGWYVSLICVVVIATVSVFAGDIDAKEILAGRRVINLSATAGRDSVNADNWQIVHMRVTAYCPCEKCCGEWSDGFTANNHEITPGDRFVAADSRYAFGTEMVIADYNHGDTVKVLDRGGAIKDNRLDVFFATHTEALQWGVRYIDVKVRKDSDS